MNLKFVVLTAVVINSTTFCDIMPCSPLKVNDVSEEHIASIFRTMIATFFTLVYCLAYSSILKMKAAYSSETSVDFQWLQYIPEDSTLNVYCIFVRLL
jgi:hypothetical protein